jgi:hypothetical protein
MNPTLFALSTRSKVREIDTSNRKAAVSLVKKALRLWKRSTPARVIEMPRRGFNGLHPTAA